MVCVNRLSGSRVLASALLTGTLLVKFWIRELEVPIIQRNVLLRCGRISARLLSGVEINRVTI